MEWWCYHCQVHKGRHWKLHPTDGHIVISITSTEGEAEFQCASCGRGHHPQSSRLPAGSHFHWHCFHQNSCNIDNDLLCPLCAVIEPGQGGIAGSLPAVIVMLSLRL